MNISSPRRDNLDLLPGDAGDQPVLVAGGTSDSHTWNLVYLQLLIEEHGRRVVNLGPCVPEDLLVEEAVAEQPALVVVSSVNGHGFHDGIRMVTRLRARQELADVPAVIGGKLGITGSSSAEQVAELKAAGYDAVFADGVDSGGIDEFSRLLFELPQRLRV
ncbi:cobalamin B12-binding domain-containing protein [Lentzea chajnantorensis]